MGYRYLPVWACFWWVVKLMFLWFNSDWIEVRIWPRVSPGSCFEPIPSLIGCQSHVRHYYWAPFHQFFWPAKCTPSWDDRCSSWDRGAWCVKAHDLCFSKFNVAPVTSLAAGRVGDVIGRRGTLFMGAVIFTVGGAIQTFTVGFWTMVAGRVVSGFGVGLLSWVCTLFRQGICWTT